MEKKINVRYPHKHACYFLIDIIKYIHWVYVIYYYFYPSLILYYDQSDFMKLIRWDIMEQ